MTTRLSGDKTHFLPFNLGNQGHAGNPPAADGGYRTAYLWREVWQRDSLLDILGRFMHLQVEEKRILTDEGIRKITKETMIFPRYHQLDSVRGRWLTPSAWAGQNYLVQNSAGSGKSNSIAWLAHRLSSLHDARTRRFLISDRGDGSPGIGSTTPEHHLPVRPQTRRGSEDRRRHAATGAGAGQRHADNHHDTAKVPVHLRDAGEAARGGSSRHQLFPQRTSSSP